MRKAIPYVLLVLVLAICAQQVRVVSLQGELADEQEARRDEAGKLGACRETRSNLLVQAVEQNQALAGLRQVESDRAAQARKAQQEGKAQAAEDYQAANRLQQERTGGDACQAAVEVIDKELGL